MTVRSLSLAALFSILAAPTIARAAEGILITQRVTTGDGNRLTTQLQIEATRMRTEVTDPNGGTQVVVFDGGKQVMYIIDAGRKTYMEMTKADVERLGAQAQGAMAQMQAQLETLPPAQRAQMEAMMKGRGMAAAPAKPQYTRAGSDKVGRWTCDKYDVLQDGQKTGELCTVNAAALGFGPTDFEVTRQLAGFFSAMAPQIATQVPSMGNADQGGYSGFPVKTVATIAGRTMTTEVAEAGRQTFPDSLFAVPAGFTKQDMPGMTGGRGAAR